MSRAYSSIVSLAACLKKGEKEKQDGHRPNFCFSRSLDPTLSPARLSSQHLNFPLLK